MGTEIAGYDKYRYHLDDAGDKRPKQGQSQMTRPPFATEHDPRESKVGMRLESMPDIVTSLEFDKIHQSQCIEFESVNVMDPLSLALKFEWLTIYSEPQ